MKAYIIIISIWIYSISFAQWSNNQNAEYVIGQPDFTTYSSGSTMQQINRPAQCAIDYINNKLYVTDIINYRVLRFSYPITSSNPTAEMYFVTGEWDPMLEQYGTPYGVAVYNGTLWICDNSHHRILKFNNAYSASSSPNPNGVLGQPDYSFPGFPGTSQSKLYSPTRIFIDNSGNLWVADGNNNRVLKFNDANNKANGANADLVLGQTDFTSFGASATQSGLNAPSGIFVSGTTVWVADNCNNRVLWYNNPTTNGANANGVLGQTDFTTGTLRALSNSTFFNPTNVSVDNDGRLYVADINHSRIMIFNDAANKSNDAPADNVLGQSTFNTSATNKGQNGFYYPNCVIIDPINNKLLVSDYLDNRILQFAASTPLPVELSSFTAGAVEDRVELRWETESETENYGFEIERASLGTTPCQDCLKWGKIGFIDGAGNSNSPKEYSFVDKNPPAGMVQYRLKQINTNGSYRYYNQVAEVNYLTDINGSNMRVPTEFALDQNYPNPFNPTTKIKYAVGKVSTGNNSNSSLQFVSLKIYDILGNEVATLVNEYKAPGYYEVEFSAGGLATGVYIYRITAGSFTATRKLMLMK